MEKLQIAKDLIKRRAIDIVRRKIERLKTPMDMVVLTLKAQKDLPEPLIALELFGGLGLGHTADYEPLCSYLELWEIKPNYAKFAKKLFKTATVKTGDSIKAIKEKKLLRESYNFIVIDNLWGCCNQEYYEHFDLFSAIFDFLGPKKGVLILSVLYNMDEIVLKEGNIPQEATRKIKEFYGINGDKGVINLDAKKVIDIYKNKVPRGKFNITSTFLVPRSSFIAYLVMVIERNG